jgi:heptaprenyl diphosphate synthase
MALDESDMRPGWPSDARTSQLLVEVEWRLCSPPASLGPIARDAWQHYIAAGGKRVRPALVLLASQWGDGPTANVIEAALAVELVHTATLYYDDVMDSAATRRGVPSANAVWGNTRATRAGSAMLFAGIAQAASLGDEAIGVLVDAMERTWRGQQVELESMFLVTRTMSEYLASIEGKTAALFELPTRLGAVCSNADPAHVDALASYGRALGVAFQMVDDVLDIVGNAEDLGKPTGNDVQEGVYTYAVIDALRCPEHSDSLRALLRGPVDSSRAGAIARLLETSGSVTRALEAARSFGTAAQRHLARVPETPGTQSLDALVGAVLRRVGTFGDG